MTYCKDYCEERGISTSKLNEAQRTLYYIAENMKMAKSIAEEGYRHFQMAIKALEQFDVLDKIRAEIEEYRSTIDYAISEDELKIEGMKEAYADCLETIDKYKAESEV